MEIALQEEVVSFFQNFKHGAQSTSLVNFRLYSFLVSHNFTICSLYLISVVVSYRPAIIPSFYHSVIYFSLFIYTVLWLWMTVAIILIQLWLIIKRGWSPVSANVSTKIKIWSTSAILANCKSNLKHLWCFKKNSSFEIWRNLIKRPNWRLYLLLVFSFSYLCYYSLLFFNFIYIDFYTR